MSEDKLIDDRHAEVRTYFVRGRNALIARGDLSRIYVDYYLHVADYDLKVTEGAAGFAKEAMAAMTLHCAARPRNERVAWTVNFQNPLLNVFVAGDSPAGSVVARTFTEHVKPGTHNLFYADVIRGDQPARRSVVDFEGGSFFAAAERYYAHSEGRIGRFFHYGDDDYVLVAAQPDCDEAWLEGLDTESVRNLDTTETLSLLEQRYYGFACGCTQDRMMRVLLPTFRQDPEALFGGEEVLRMSCPRCGARHAITREALEALDIAEAA